MSNREFTATRTMLANGMATAGAELLEYMGVGAALAAIPNTEPPKYVVAGTLQMIAKMLPTLDVAAPAAQAPVQNAEEVRRHALEEALSQIAKCYVSIVCAHDPEKALAYNDAITAAIECVGSLASKEAAAAEAPSQWISVEDRLPESETDVLIIRLGQIHVGAIFIEHESWEEGGREIHYWDDSNDDGQGWDWDEVTHWMPLPAAPQQSAQCEKGGDGE